MPHLSQCPPTHIKITSKDGAIKLLPKVSVSVKVDPNGQVFVWQGPEFMLAAESQPADGTMDAWPHTDHHVPVMETLEQIIEALGGTVVQTPGNLG